MTPMERLQAAIDKLELQLHDSAGRGAHAWAAHSTTDNPSGHDAAIRGVGFPDDFFDGVADVYDPADAALIVTLHRTIDAQLAILRATLDAEMVERNWETLVYTINALTLADDILGGEL